MVLADDGRLEGILTKTDILKPVKTRLVLVDHNEMTQAVPGAGEVVITEVIDHHRLGVLNTAQPILFINEPVGSTCTIVADLFRRENLAPSADLAGLMMAGIISDTLNLNSPTSTEKDGALLRWLSAIAGVDAAGAGRLHLQLRLGHPRQSAGQGGALRLQDLPRGRRALCRGPGRGARFRQLLGPCEAAVPRRWRRCARRSASLFAGLLVTDINSQNSLLLVKGDAEIIARISYPHVEQDEIFDLPGIVSRKKQLIPYLTGLLKEMQAEGAMPRAPGEA